MTLGANFPPSGEREPDSAGLYALQQWEMLPAGDLTATEDQFAEIFVVDYDDACLQRQVR